MNCPKCQYPNTAAARFCAGCGASLEVAPAGPGHRLSPGVPAPARGNKTALIVLGVLFGVVLLFAIGVYGVVHRFANKVRALVGDGAQTSSQQGPDADAKQGAKVMGNVIGGLLGTDAKGKSDIGTALNHLALAGQRIDEHQRAAGGSGDATDAQDTQQAMQATGNLLGALAGSLGGAQRHDPVDFHTLQGLLPAALPGMQRGAPRGESDQAMGIKSTSAGADYAGADHAHINVSISDATAVSGIAGLAQMADRKEWEQGDSYERNRTLRGYTVHEKWDAPGRHGELSLIIAKRFGVTVTGYNIDMGALESALAQVDFGKLEAMKDANPRPE